MGNASKVCKKNEDFLNKVTPQKEPYTHTPANIHSCTHILSHVKKKQKSSIPGYILLGFYKYWHKTTFSLCRNLSVLFQV